MRRTTPITTASGLAAAMTTALAMALTLGPPTEAKGQGAIGFQPVVTPFSDGVFLTATPAVSADRRHVRLGVDTSINALRGVQPFSFTAGAVSGGGTNVGGIGGIGGLNSLGGASSTAVIPGLGAVGPVGGYYSVYGWPGIYAGYPYGYGYPAPVISGYPTGPLYTGPYYGYNPSFVPQTTNSLQPMGLSIMNAIAPGSWGFPVR